MPNFKGHLAGGFFIYLVVFYWIVSNQTVSLTTSLEWLLFALAGSLFPDVDTKSKGQKIFYWIVLFLAALLLSMSHMEAFVILGFLSLFPLLVRHRGIFHRTWFVILVPSLVASFCCMYMPNCSSIIMYDTLFFIMGALSHLWLDVGIKGMLRW
jgi:hypothetical protein